MNDEISIQFDLNSIASYQLFLKVKSLPRYRIVGRTAIIPAEYADRLGVDYVADTSSKEYVPSSFLFDYQAGVSRLAIQKEKFAAFVECGKGKTLIMAEYVKYVESMLDQGECILIVCPLMVIRQTISEFNKFYGDSLPIERIKAADLNEWLVSGTGRIGITNYEALHDRISQGRMKCLCLDESAMLKSMYGKWGQECLRLGAGLRWKLALTGLAAPNDRIEYANHAVLLDAFPNVNSFLAKFFVNRGQTDNRWEIKPHALIPFYRALSHWSIFLNDPATYGWQDNAGPPPPIIVHIEEVELTKQQQKLAYRDEGTLFPMEPGGITSRSVLSQIAKGNHKGKAIETLKPAYIKSLVDSWPEESTIIWCLPPDEPVVMADGTDRPIADVQIGDMVLSGSGIPREVTKLFDRHHVGDMMEIHVRGIPKPIRMTPEHRIPTMDGWKSSGDVLVGDRLIEPRIKLENISGSHNDGWVVGLYAAQGSRVRGASGNQNFVCFATHQDKTAEAISHVETKVGFAPMISDREGSLVKVIRLSDRGLRDLVDEWVLGNRSPIKMLSRLPENHDFSQGVLDGWMAGDGSITRNGRCRTGQTSSPSMARQMAILASALGFSVTMFTGKNRPGPMARSGGNGTLTPHDWHRVGVSIDAGHYSQPIIHSDKVFREVTRVDRIQYSGNVHDITVDVDHTFLTRGIAVSNCVFNHEQDLMAKMFPNAANIAGSTPHHIREEMIADFQVGRRKILLSKGKILGLGLNLQIATRHVFSGLIDSYETYFQCVKRSNRVGSTKPLHVYLPITEIERPMIETVLKKAARVDSDTVEMERLFRHASNS